MMPVVPGYRVLFLLMMVMCLTAPRVEGKVPLYNL